MKVVQYSCSTRSPPFLHGKIALLMKGLHFFSEQVAQATNSFSRALKCEIEEETMDDDQSDEELDDELTDSEDEAEFPSH